MQELANEQELFMALCQTLVCSPYIIRAQCETLQSGLEHLPQAKFDLVIMNYLKDKAEGGDDDDSKVDQPKLISLLNSEEDIEAMIATTDTSIYSNPSKYNLYLHHVNDVSYSSFLADPQLVFESLIFAELHTKNVVPIIAGKYVIQ